MGKNSGIAIRLMTEQDIPALQRLHMEVFEGYNTTLMGASYLKGLYRTLACDTACTSIVATKDDEIFGWIGGVGHWGAFEKALMKSNILRSPAILFSVLKNRPVLLKKAFAVVWRVLMQFFQGLAQKKEHSEGAPPSVADSSPRATAILLVIGVTPERRNQSVGQLIMEDFHRRLLSKGFAAATLNTSSDNKAANRAFQKAGYDLFWVNDGMNHCVKDLTENGVISP